MNGHVEEMEQGKDEDKPEETDTNTSQVREFVTWSSQVSQQVVFVA